MMAIVPVIDPQTAVAKVSQSRISTGLDPCPFFHALPNISCGEAIHSSNLLFFTFPYSRKYQNTETHNTVRDGKLFLFSSLFPW
jgi:hypothetical protein